MQEANSDTKFQKGQQDADFFKKLHKVICVPDLCCKTQGPATLHADCM